MHLPGAFNFPQTEACEIAIETVGEWLAQHALPRQVTFCCYLDADARRYRTRLRA